MVPNGPLTRVTEPPRRSANWATMPQPRPGALQTVSACRARAADPTPSSATLSTTRPRSCLQRDAHHPWRAAGEGVLEGVGHQLEGHDADRPRRFLRGWSTSSRFSSSRIPERRGLGVIEIAPAQRLRACCCQRVLATAGGPAAGARWPKALQPQHRLRRAGALIGPTGLARAWPDATPTARPGARCECGGSIPRAGARPHRLPTGTLLGAPSTPSITDPLCWRLDERPRADERRSIGEEYAADPPLGDNGGRRADRRVDLPIGGELRQAAHR